MKFLRRIILFLVVCAALLSALYFFAPWRPFVERQVQGALQARGFENISFHIRQIGLHGVELSDIVLGKENPLIIPSVTLAYSPRELMGGSLDAIKLSGLRLQAIETDSGWVFTGMDVLPKSEGVKKETDIPALLNSLPFTRLDIGDSDIKIIGKSVQGDVPFTLSLGSSLSLETKPASVAIGSAIVTLGVFDLKAAPASEGWKGSWTLASAMFGADMPVPPLIGEGSLSVTKSRIAADGNIHDDRQAYKASLNGSFDLDLPSSDKIVLASASFPFKQGTVSTRNVTLKRPMTIPLTVKKVSVGDLLAAFTGERVSATGTFSGTVPLTIGQDGRYSIGTGSLKADGVGLIQMPGELIPGDNAQVELVRQILENLHYSLLSAAIENGKGGKMTVRLNLEGNNPDVYNGRPVKLNLNLTGDLLDIAEQNIMLFGDPEKLMEQGTHE